MTSIRLANKKDCFAVAKIHFQEINSGFLNQLGEKFLCCFYEAMIDSANNFLIIAEDNGFVIGFVSGSANLNGFYKEFAKKYFLKTLFILIKRIFNKDIVKKILETKKYSKKENLPELLSIAVLSRFQGQGIARKLLDKLISEMKKRNILSFRVIVGQDLEANSFYIKNGFKFLSKDFVHKNSPSNIYLFDIKN